MVKNEIVLHDPYSDALCAAGCFLSPWMDGWMCVHWKYMALILKWSSLQRAERILNWLLPPINATESPHGWFHPPLRLKGSFVFFTNNVSYSTDFIFLFCLQTASLITLSCLSPKSNVWRINRVPSETINQKKRLHSFGSHIGGRQVSTESHHFEESSCGLFIRWAAECFTANSPELCNQFIAAL